MILPQEAAHCLKCDAVAEFGYTVQGITQWFCDKHKISQNYADARVPKANTSESKQANDVYTTELDKLQVRHELAQHAKAIRAASTRVIADIIEIGRHLVEVNKLCEHGEWLPWLEREFGWSHSTADRFIQVYRTRDKLPTRGQFEFPLSAQYLLAAPSTPPEARQEIKKRVESGERVTAAQVKETIAEAKKPPSPSTHSRTTTPDPPPNHKQIAAGLTLAKQMSLATLDEFLVGLRQLRREKKRHA